MRQADRQHEDDAGREASGGDGVRMEVREPSATYLASARFQESEVGLIPLDWEAIALATRAAIQSGIAKNTNATLRDPISVPYLRVANVQDGYLDLGEVSTIDIERTDLRRYAVLPGDVLMNEGGDLDKLGRGAIWNGQIRSCVHQNHVFVVRCGQGLIPEYLNAWTSSAQARRYFMLAGRQTTNLASINKTSLGELTVAIPPTEREQHEIAAALIDADALIDSLEQLLTKKRRIKQGAMQELLTGKRRLSGFSTASSQGGALPPSDWEAQAIGDFAEVKTGPFGSALHERDYVQSGTPIITVEHLAERGIQGEGAPQVGETDVMRLQAYKLEEGDIVFSRVGSIDRNARVSAAETGWLFSGRLLRLRLKSKEVDSQFLSYLFHGEPFRNQVERVAVGQTMASLNTKLLSGLEVVLPTAAEQKVIAESLAAMDANLAALEARLTKARALKQAMAQALLTGRIRLVAPTT